jgi:hypothetical protein
VRASQEEEEARRRAAAARAAAAPQLPKVSVSSKSDELRRAFEAAERLGKAARPRAGVGGAGTAGHGDGVAAGGDGRGSSGASWLPGSLGGTGSGTLVRSTLPSSVLDGGLTTSTSTSDLFEPQTPLPAPKPLPISPFFKDAPVMEPMERVERSGLVGSSVAQDISAARREGQKADESK